MFDLLGQTKRFLGPRPPVLGLVAHMLFNKKKCTPTPIPLAG